MHIFSVLNRWSMKTILFFDILFCCLILIWPFLLQLTFVYCNKLIKKKKNILKKNSVLGLGIEAFDGHFCSTVISFVKTKTTYNVYLSVKYKNPQNILLKKKNPNIYKFAHFLENILFFKLKKKKYYRLDLIR